MKLVDPGVKNGNHFTHTTVTGRPGGIGAYQW